MIGDFGFGIAEFKIDMPKAKTETTNI